MKSAVFYGKHDLRLEEYEMPVVGPEDVLIQVKPSVTAGRETGSVLIPTATAEPVKPAETGLPISVSI